MIYNMAQRELNNGGVSHFGLRVCGGFILHLGGCLFGVGIDRLTGESITDLSERRLLTAFLIKKE